MTAAFQKVIDDQFSLLFFRPFKPNLTEHAHVYFAWGLFSTWLVGIGRYWDHPNAETWQYWGIGSVVYVFVLAAFIWLIALPLAPKNWTYRNVLIFIMLTSLPAILYAIPVERFMSLKNAQTVNVWFLATVAIWRVFLLFSFLKNAAKLNSLQMTTVGLLPLAVIVVTLVVLNLEHAVFQIMGGIRGPTSNDSAYGVLLFISVLSVIALPILLISYAVECYKTKKDT